MESRCSIDTATLKRRKLLVPGTLKTGSFSWTRDRDQTTTSSVGYVVTVEEASGTLALAYKLVSDDTELAYPIPLVTTPCHLGGVRWWFICPLSQNGIACGNRVRKLYLHGKYFGCRRCHRLTYTSCQESDSRVYALARAAVYAMGDPSGMSVMQLGLALKTLAIQQKRFNRLFGE